MKTLWKSLTASSPRDCTLKAISGFTAATTTTTKSLVAANRVASSSSENAESESTIPLCWEAAGWGSSTPLWMEIQPCTMEKKSKRDLYTRVFLPQNEPCDVEDGNPAADTEHLAGGGCWAGKQSYPVSASKLWKLIWNYHFEIEKRLSCAEILSSLYNPLGILFLWLDDMRTTRSNLRCCFDKFPFGLQSSFFPLLIPITFPQQ